VSSTTGAEDGDDGKRKDGPNSNERLAEFTEVTQACI
jgi:hypothetical protein